MTFIDTEIYVYISEREVINIHFRHIDTEIYVYISEREVINIHFRHMSRILTEKATLLIN